MRHSAFSRQIPAALFILALCLILPASPIAQTASDTAGVDETEGEKSGGRVLISIDEDGISVEGSANIKTDEVRDADDWVEIQDWRGDYKEKGLDIVKFAESVFVGKDELVRGELVVFGGNAVIEGKVIGNVVVIGGDIRARSGAHIKGDVVVVGGELDEDEDVIINGERVIVRHFIPVEGLMSVFKPGGGLLKLVFIPMLFVQLVLAFLVVLFLRGRLLTGQEHLSSNYLKSFGIGLLSAFIGLFALILVVTLLFITFIGILLAPVVIMSCIAIFIISWTIFVYSLGKLVAEKLQIHSDNAFLFVLIGAVLINLPTFISFVAGLTGAPALAPIAWAFTGLGWLVKGFAYLSGFGALILSRFGSRPLVRGVTPAPTAPQATGAA